MKKFILTEEEENNIRIMYGLLIEEKYMEKYSGNLLDFCGYRAIEQFEETMGNSKGESMGEDYFEGQVETYEKLIRSNIENTITNDVFQKFPQKLKMQIWSFMFNSTDASNGTIKWIAGLGQAMGLNKNSDAKTEQEYRIRVMDKNSKEYKNVIESIKDFKGSWDTVYNNYLKVLDQQYKSTAINNKKEGSYNNSWQYRPSKLNQFYDECSKSSQQPTTTTQQPEIKTTKSSTEPENKTVTKITGTEPSPEIVTKTSGTEPVTTKSEIEPVKTTVTKTTETKPEVESESITNFKKAIEKNWVDDNGNSQLNGKEKYSQDTNNSKIFIVDSDGVKYKYEYNSRKNIFKYLGKE